MPIKAPGAGQYRLPSGRFRSVFLLLQVPHPRVIALGIEQRDVRSALDDLAILHDQYFVGDFSDRQTLAALLGNSFLRP